LRCAVARPAVGLAPIAALALGLRLWGIGFGLPYLYHPDEPAYVLQALAVARGLPDGLTFANPPLYKYLLLGEYGLAYGTERLAGITRSQAQFIQQFRADPSVLYLIARLSSAVFGALTAVATAALGANVGGARAGILAGGLTAVAFLLVRDAHFGTDDSLVTLLVTLGLVACIRVAQRGCRRDYVAAGGLAGLAFAAKYDGIALLAPLVLAHVVRTRSATGGWGAPQSTGAAASRLAGRRPTRWRLRLGELALAGAACVAAALVAFPSLVTEPGRVLKDIYVHLYLEATGGYDGLDLSGGYVFYARTLAIGLGAPLLVGAIAGVAISAAKRNWPSLVVVSLPLAMLGVLGSQQLYFARFALPALPALIVMASLALDWLFERQIILGAVALVVVAAPTLAESVRFDRLMTQTDTRTLATQWVQSELPAEVTYAADAPPLGPPLDQQHNAAVGLGALFDLSLDDYRARGVDYVITSSYTAEARAIDPEREARRVAFNAALARDATLVASFTPGDVRFEYDQVYAPYTQLDRLERPGPTLNVYRLTR
jgi:dolichyl-phosphate-mannose-protein mannosyltransferase